MLKALKEVYTFGQSINEKLKVNEKVASGKFKEFAERIVNLGFASQKYVDAKNLSQYTDRGKERFSLATQMRDLAQENFSIKEMTVKENVEPNEMKEHEEELQL